MTPDKPGAAKLRPGPRPSASGEAKPKSAGESPASEPKAKATPQNKAKAKPKPEPEAKATPKAKAKAKSKAKAQPKAKPSKGKPSKGKAAEPASDSTEELSEVTPEPESPTRVATWGGVPVSGDVRTPDEHLAAIQPMQQQLREPATFADWVNQGIESEPSLGWEKRLKERWAKRKNKS